MEQITYETSLALTIRQLEIKRTEEEQLLRDQFYQTLDSFKPINMIKSTFHAAIAPGELRGEIVNATVGVGAGLLSKVIFSRVMKSPLRKAIGTALMVGVTELVARNPEMVKAAGRGFFNLIRRRGRNDEDINVL